MSFEARHARDGGSPNYSNPMHDVDTDDSSSSELQRMPSDDRPADARRKALLRHESRHLIKSPMSSEGSPRGIYDGGEHLDVSATIEDEEASQKRLDKGTKQSRHDDMEAAGAMFFVNHPSAPTRFLWKTASLMTMVYIFFELPHRLAFEHSYYWATGQEFINHHTLAMTFRDTGDRLIDMFLFVLFIRNFTLAYYKYDVNGVRSIETGIMAIAHRYVFGESQNSDVFHIPFTPTVGFVLDCLSCLPIDFALYLATGQLDLALRIRMLRLIRTKEVFELTPYWNHFMGFLSILLPGLKNFTSIITLTAALLSFTHLTACTLYFAGLPEFDTHDCNEHGTCGWVAALQWTSVNSTEELYDGCDPHVHGCRPTSMRTHYVSAYYYAFTVLTTVGFGDISAHSEAERVVNVIIMVFGAYIFAIVMGSVSSLIMEGNQGRIQYTLLLDETLKFFAYRNVNRSLRRKVERYYSKVFPDQVIYDERQILNRLPPQFRNDILLDMYENVLRNMPFLPDLDELDLSYEAREHIEDIRIEVCNVLTTVSFLENTIIGRQGLRSKTMYIVQKGTVGVYRDNTVNAMVGTVPPGGMFGGVTVLLQTRQDWTYKVETFVTCARLRRHDINDIIERYPTFKKKVKEWVTDRQLEIQSMFGEETDKSGNAPTNRTDKADLDEITAVTRLQARYRGRKVRHVRQGMQDMELDRPMLTKGRYEKLKGEGTIGEVMIAVGMVIQKLELLDRKQDFMAKELRQIKHMTDNRLGDMEHRDLTVKHVRGENG